MKALVATLLALVTFVATHLAIGGAIEQRPDLRLLPDSTEAKKFRHFLAHGDEYDLVYVGTSRVHRGFDTTTFDREMSDRLGAPVRSYNFGLLGLGYLEERYIVEWILSRRPARLRWLLIEPTERSAPWIARPIVLGHDGPMTLRDVYWHSPAVTVAGLHANWLADRTFSRKLEYARSHLMHGAHRLFNLGVGAGLLAQTFAPIPLGEDLPGGFDGREAMPDDPTEVVAPPREPEVKELSGLNWQTATNLVALASEGGVAARLVVPPSTRPLRSYVQARDSGALPGLVLYPLDAIPEMKADTAAYFYDPEHLNTRGAALFAQRLAADLAPDLARDRAQEQ